MTGDLVAQIADLTAFMPVSGSEDFVEPESSEMLAFSQLIEEIQKGNLEKSVIQSSDLNYELIEFVDRGDENASSYLLREEKPIQKGWGLYLIRKASPNKLIIEAPHPTFDRYTPQIALEIFRALNAYALLIAGSHRRANADLSADVAHNPQTIFQTVHETLIKSEEGYVILQIHGFESSKYPGYPQVVLSSNQVKTSDLLGNLTAAFVDHNISVGVCDGTSWKSLCAQTNVQLISTTEDTFIHLELNEIIRDNPQTVTDLIEQVFNQ